MQDKQKYIVIKFRQKNKNQVEKSSIMEHLLCLSNNIKKNQNIKKCKNYKKISNRNV